MSMLDLAALERAPLVREPFDFAVVPGFLKPEAAASVERDFPAIGGPGSFPPSTLRFGPAFRALIDELQGPAFARALGAKLGLPLSELPTMLTVRGYTAAHDGRIHHDRRGKVVTALLYFNRDWQEKTGWLRMLRSKDDLEDYVAEVPPEMGTLLVFRCTPNAWHGHKPFVGQRRAIQLNWVNSRLMCNFERFRHWQAAVTKPIKLLLTGQKAA
ncbi:MAG: 2OG-Fe(II) oxygenase [Alphaproteobacteria bacterium]|nr:2OG-Fe(II) oxygenase [Alphaproteobacteria bacterium]